MGHFHLIKGSIFIIVYSAKSGQIYSLISSKNSRKGKKIDSKKSQISSLTSQISSKSSQISSQNMSIFQQKNTIGIW